ncbi:MULTISPECIES: GGDEF domain-containing protein [unclassified Crossiella]|uniref:GGDEF domain-containing protein n=1 Tax=unclassified Crossiella TaxID=2620835 RepID=UPI001FFF7507|nr:MULTISPECIES: GGDEF domain-containing protein [unclassified Crossiella]MCK2241875.1 GGDEF domain-containing protein [Crossiella sp. S99.2]MCK2255778.1 GGDEF domain-containing protein [Crossiella sp. S99.1]
MAEDGVPTSVGAGPRCDACGQALDSARRDHLTRLPDRWAWEVEAPQALRVAADRGTSLVLLVLDIDNFKKINDTCGHLAGDEVLRAVATALRAAVRRGDVLSRYGGDEFLALCTVTDEHDAIDVARQMCQAVRELDVRAPDARRGTAVMISEVTVSIGAAFFPAIHGCAIGLTEALRHADAALLEAKSMSEDRTCLVFLGSDATVNSGVGDRLPDANHWNRT